MSSNYIPGSVTGPTAVAAQAGDETAVERRNSSSPVLMLAAPVPAKPKFGTLFWLAHVLGLDVFGTATLSYAARVDMNAAALVLATIFLFDLTAWCLFFYFIINSGSIDFSPGRIVFASGGILPAVALLLYERSFMTADSKSRGWVRLVLPTVLRLGVIVGAAWITAQPVEMLTFGQRIKDRVQQELVRKNIVGYYRELNEAVAQQGNAAGAGEEVLQDLMQQRNGAQTRLNDARTQYDDTKISLEKVMGSEKAASSELAYVLASVRERITSANSHEDPNADPAVKTARAKHEKFKAEAAQLTTQLKQSEAAQQHTQEDLDKAEQRLPQAIARKKADVTEKGLDNWVATLRSAQPGQDKTSLEGEKLYQFVFVDYDFLDKFRIIDDVLSGRPPRWPGADLAMIADLKQRYGMYDDNDIAVKVNTHANTADPNADPPQGVGVDPAAQERNLAQTRNANRMYWTIFGVAAIIPLLSLLFKLIMPAHLAYYYSSEWQAQQGNPWAIAMEAAITSMKDQQARRRIARGSPRKSSVTRLNNNFPGE